METQTNIPNPTITNEQVSGQPQFGAWNPNQQPAYTQPAQFPQPDMTGAQQQPTGQQSTQEPNTLEGKLKQIQDKWTNEITELNNMMKTLPRLDELLNIIYTRRQEAVDHYHGMNSVIIKQTKDYKQKFSMICMNARINGVNGLRLSNDSAIQKHVEGVLLDEKAAIEQLGNHNTFIKETVQTIDNMIYGINQKIKLAEILNGLKF